MRAEMTLREQVCTTSRGELPDQVPLTCYATPTPPGVTEAAGCPC